MNLFEERIQQTKAYFESGDEHLGFRRTLDCVMDSEDLSLYEEAIALTGFRHQHPEDAAGIKQRAFQLLDKVGQLKLNLYDRNQAVIVAQDITKTYGHSQFKLGPVSLQLSKAQVYGLVGENGNGKTTLLRMLAKELSLTDGKIAYHFNKKMIGDYDLRTRLIYIPQRTEKWYGSLKNNLRFVLAHYGTPAQEIESRMMMMICRLGLWKYQDYMWDQLSSGYKMRFELARTLLRKPEVLLLDEPLANLDVMAQQVILEDLKFICNSLTKPIAMILSSQQLYEVEKISDKVIFLKEGQYHEDKNNLDTAPPDALVVEIDSRATKEAIQQALNGLKVLQLQNIGGVYIAQFDVAVSFSQVLSALGASGLELFNVRNITSSTRRFFVA